MMCVLKTMNNLKKFSMRLDGGRFRDQSIPLDSFSDLALIEKIIMDIASDIFLEENPERKRAPRNFKKNYYLSMTKLTQGSTVAELSVSNRIPQQVFESEEEKSIGQAFDDFIDYLGNNLEMEKFEKRGSRIRPRLKSFGRSLRDGESVEFMSGGKKSVYNQKIRHELMEASTEYADEIELYGNVLELDKKSGTFRLHYMENGKEKQVYVILDNVFENLAYEALGKSDQKVFIRGTGSFKNQGLQKIEAIEDLQLLDPRDIQSRLNDLKDLKHGWLEGEGTVPSAEELTRLSELFDIYYKEDDNLPYIYPTPDGNLELEWTINGAELILEIDLSTLNGNILRICGETEDEFELNLNDQSGWNELDEILRGVTQ